jgi:hypothetical protein
MAKTQSHQELLDSQSDIVREDSRTLVLNSLNTKKHQIGYDSDSSSCGTANKKKRSKSTGDPAVASNYALQSGN